MAGGRASVLGIDWDWGAVVTCAHFATRFGARSRQEGRAAAGSQVAVGRSDSGPPRNVGADSDVKRRCLAFQGGGAYYRASSILARHIAKANERFRCHRWRKIW